MAKKKSIFLPMTNASFEQSFRANISCGRSAVWPLFYINEGFIGRISGGRFSFYYHQPYNHGLATVMAGKAKKQKNGLLLTYHYRKSIFTTVLCCFCFVFLLAFLTVCFLNIENMDSYNFLLAPIFIFVMALLFLFVRTPKAKQKLFQKLNEVCCGMLQGNEGTGNKF